MSITLRQLEAFLAVAEESHFRRAAERLHTSQPAVVSQEIRRLERTLGTPLFDRSTRTVRLTPAGTAVLDDARAVWDAAQQFVDRASRLTEERAGRLRVAATPSATDGILPAVLRRVEHELPDILVEEIDIDTGDVADALLTRGCDVGIGRFLDPPPGYQTEMVRTERVFVALSSQDPLARDQEADLAALEDLPLLLWPRERNPRYHDRLRTICTERGLDPLLLVSPPRGVGGHSYLIADGRAFGLVPQSTAHRLTGDITAVPLARQASLPMSVAWPKRDPRPLVATFVALIRETSAGLGRASRAWSPWVRVVGTRWR